MKTLKITLVVILVLVTISIVTSCKSDGCDYDKDCPTLNLNIGEPCDSNENGIADGTVTEFCQCHETFDCQALQLNIGDPCSVNNDGNINGNINEDCECIPG